jgi:4-hydroxy-tetrahydrodipicolinate synthase
MFKGSLVALLTPFTAEGKIDEKAFRAFVAWQIENGTHGLIPCGTTGESPTLSHDEHKRVVELCVEVARGKRPVIAGTGSNSTVEAIELTRHAKDAGADAALVVTPYYNRPTQDGLYLHFKAIHDAVEIPIVIYNIPGRCAVDMSPETMGRLAQLPRIVGVKDATNDLARPHKTRRTCGETFCQLSGEDATALAFLAQGGDGCISVTANVAPRQLADMHEAWARGEVKKAQALNDRLMPLHEALFVETSPAPVKFAASLMAKSRADCRLPLAPLTDATRERVSAAMRGAGLIN